MDFSVPTLLKSAITISLQVAIGESMPCISCWSCSGKKSELIAKKIAQYFFILQDKHHCIKYVSCL